MNNQFGDIFGENIFGNDNYKNIFDKILKDAREKQKSPIPLRTLFLGGLADRTSRSYVVEKTIIQIEHPDGLKYDKYVYKGKNAKGDYIYEYEKTNYF